MAIEYDSDDIGELDDEEADGCVTGTATTDQYHQLLTEFLEQHPTQDHNHEAGYAYDAAGAAAGGQSAPIDEAAIAKVHHTPQSISSDKAGVAKAHHAIHSSPSDKASNKGASCK